MEQIRHLFVVPFAGVCWVLLRSALFFGLRLTKEGSVGAGGELMSYLLEGIGSSRSANTIILQPDKSPELPHGGALYRLGDLHRHRQTANKPRYLQIRTLNKDARVTYDMLWNDLKGAFDQDVISNDNTVMNISWREPHEPLFLVVYGNISDYEVEYREDQHFACNSTAMEVYNYPRRDLYYRRRTGTGGKVTLCTQITPERLQYLHYIAQNWGGPVSAAVFVGFKSDDQDEDISIVNTFWEQIGEEIRANLDLHLVYDDKQPWYSTSKEAKSRLGNNPYPVNILRQIAVNCANSDWVLMIEGDMLSVPNAHNLIGNSWSGMMKAYGDSGGAAFVVPLYKVRKSIDEETFQNFPKDKQGLLGRVNAKKNLFQAKKTKKLQLDVTDDYFRASKSYRNQELTDYDGWEGLPAASETYLPYHKSGRKGIICDIPEGYTEQEPYVLVKKEDMPPYNVMFAGMWWDKTTHIVDMCNCGLKYMIHPALFSVIFNEPPGSGRPGEWGGHVPNWRQEFVFALGPAYSQEYQKSRLANNASRTMCSRVAGVPVGDPQPYQPWVPFWVNNTRNGQLKLVTSAAHMQWMEDIQKYA